MSPQAQDNFDALKEANQAAHQALHKREAQGLQRDGPLEQAMASNLEDAAREFFYALAEEKKYEKKHPSSKGKDHGNEMEDLITL